MNMEHPFLRCLGKKWLFCKLGLRVGLRDLQENFVSAFFSGFVLQNEHTRALLMMVNDIEKAMNFNQSKLIA